MTNLMGQGDTETKGTRHYLVLSDTGRVPLSEHLLHGYESRMDFRRAVRELADRWKGRVGECVGERHGFRLLRFHDTPGGRPDEEWIPNYLLQPADVPDGTPPPEDPDQDGGKHEVVDGIFGFD